MNKTEKKIVIVQTTVASQKEAQNLSALVLRKRLGACAHLIPIASKYRWKGKIESAQEILVQIKTRPELAGKLAAFIRKNHSYELPEIIVTNSKADPGYARWIAEETV